MKWLDLIVATLVVIHIVYMMVFVYVGNWDAAQDSGGTLLLGAAYFYVRTTK